METLVLIWLVSRLSRGQQLCLPLDGAGYGICPLAMDISTLNSKNTHENLRNLVPLPEIR